MPAPEIIHQLVAKFEENREAYRSGKYNEARLRQEFLDKFFIALGWDVYNEKGVAPEYCDVIVEDSLDIEGTSKAPDYAFKIGRERKFYVEAKKPKVDIQYDIHPAYQLRRYAWNAHLPLSILTDFEEFAVYNCKSKPSPSDSAATARDRFYRYTDYIEKWDEIAAVFSRDAVWKGSFDRFAETSKGKKGTTEVDDEFLKEMSEWRMNLARNIALRNPQVTDEAQLNYAVQMTIDRILFLRICEDRGIEPEEQLKTIACKPAIYPRLLELFRRADVKYNSGLFHFNHEKGSDISADTFTPTLKIDDKVLKEIIASIYYPCPYIFKEIPVEILGQVYEQFLGKVIRLTPSHQAKVEEKPEVRKAGGVYYTPKYIVDYIVQNTVGELLKDKTPDQAAELKIVDPACGSGSFLLGAYQHLLDWHLKWYTQNDPEKWIKGKTPALVQVTGGYRLTTQKKKEILLNNIHGVDIDAQAVEVTKLSLLLKVLEEESGQLSLGFERTLPDLGRNIQCGNSLIGWDYFEGRLAVDEQERRRVNPFDWQVAFPQVFARGASGGFDAVIGNPPYGAMVSDNENNYYQKKFISKDKDTYALFIEKAIGSCKSGGLISMIVPTGWYSGASYSKLRKHFMVTTNPKVFVNLPYDIFHAWVDTTIFITSKRANIIVWPSFGKSTTLLITFPKKFKIQSLNDFNNISRNIDVSLWFKNNANEFITYADSDSLGILRKIEKTTVPLSAIADVQRGVTPFHLDDEPIYKTSQFAFDGSVRRYICEKANIKYIKYDESLAEYKPKRYFEGNRILLRELISRQFRLQAVIVEENFITNKSMQSILNLQESPNLAYILGILNSKFLSWYFLKKSNIGQRDDFPKIVLKETRGLPIRPIDFNSPGDVKRHDLMVSLVQRMLDLHKRVPATPQEAERIKREIESTDRQIDQLVYELYGLTDEEIAIVEGA